MNNFAAMPAISDFLRAHIAAGDFPSAVYLIGERGIAVFADSLGDAVLEPETHPATLETIYDLASLTKPLVTGLLCARLVQLGALDLEAPVASYLPEFTRTEHRSITIRRLLTHTSGLPAWRPVYLLAQEKDEALIAIAKQDLEYKPGERVVYSDLGFIVLGFLLMRLTGKAIPDLARQEIFNPLEFKRTFFNPEQAMRTGIAACETGNAYERDMCETQFGSVSSATADRTGVKPFAIQQPFTYTWRDGTIWGEVHDGNAHFLGGVAGHAGLFSNAIETLQLANQFIASKSQILSATICESFKQNMTEGLNEARSFAWQLAATKDSTAGNSLPPNAFGHTGFTGTSCWIDAERERVFILLTNRTHHRSLPFANINAVRREFHSLAVRALAGR